MLRGLLKMNEERKTAHAVNVGMSCKEAASALKNCTVQWYDCLY